MSSETTNVSARILAATHRRAKRRKHPVLRTVGITFLALLLFFGTALGTVVVRLQTSINQHNFMALINNERPAEAVPLDQKSGQPLNILLLGSDSRAGANSQTSGDKVDGMRADTTMLVHVSADRKRVDVVSIPRDTLVNIPSCTLPNGEHTAEQYDAMFNSAFAIGGQTNDVNAAATCTLQTVERLTNILIDGYVVVDFASFIGIVDALGGVEMCFKEDLNDDKAQLHLTAGCHNLTGQEALAFTRARKSLGDGSDISRISRQQEFMSKMFSKMFEMNVFADLPSFYKIVKSVSANLDTSQGLGDFNWLSGFLYSMRNVKQADITFMTMPLVAEGYRVRPSSKAEQVWEALRTDVVVPEEAKDDPRPESEKVTVDDSSTTSDSSSTSDSSTSSESTPDSSSSQGN